MSDLTGARKDTSKDDTHSDDSQETTFSDKSNMMLGQDTSNVAETEVETELTHRAATNNKRRYPYWPLFFIMAATTGESYSISGVIAVSEFYFTRFLYICFGNIDVGLGTASVNIVIGLNLVSGLLGGFLADRVLGNFKTQAISNIISSICAIVLIFSTWQYTLNQPSCCPSDSENVTLNADHAGGCEEIQRNILLSHLNLHIPPSINIAISIIALVLFAISTGILWIQSVFVADQFGDEGENSKEQQRAFSVYYFWVTLGVLAGDAGMPILRQTTGFVITYLTNAGVFVCSTIIFMLGWCVFIKKPHTRVRYKCSCRKTVKKIKMYCSSSRQTGERQTLLSSTSTEASLSGSFGKPKHESVIARVKELIPIMKVFFPLTMYWAVSYQRYSSFVLQAVETNCRLGSIEVPPDMMPSIQDFLMLLVIPLLEYIIHPHLQSSMNIKIRPIHKLTAGMVCGALSFLLAGLLQLYLTEPDVDCRGDVSIAWQLPQLFLLSFGDVLIFVTGLEFSYTEAPPDLRNIVIALWIIIQGLGTIFNAGIAFLPISLLISFFLYVGLMVLLTVAFILLNRNYKYRATS